MFTESQEKEAYYDFIEELTEQIVIEYANNINLEEFRSRVRELLKKFLV